jgi:hypothetical protein
VIRALVYGSVGFAAAWLYLNPGDLDGLLKVAREGVNSAATTVVEATDKSNIAKVEETYESAKSKIAGTLSGSTGGQ